MHLTEAVSIATSSLWAHKLRSVLTLIGVVIGVTSVIAVVSLINGANQYVATRVFRLGADVFGLSKQPSIITNVDDFLEFQKRKRITYEDFEAVRDLCESCKDVGAALGGRVEVKSGLESGLSVVSARVSGLKAGAAATLKAPVVKPAGESNTTAPAKAG